MSHHIFKYAVMTYMFAIVSFSYRYSVFKVIC